MTQLGKSVEELERELLLWQEIVRQFATQRLPVETISGTCYVVRPAQRVLEAFQKVIPDLKPEDFGLDIAVSDFRSMCWLHRDAWEKRRYKPGEEMENEDSY